MVDRFNFYTDECEVHLRRHATAVGGFDEESIPIIVEIDERSIFTENTTGTNGDGAIGINNLSKIGVSHTMVDRFNFYTDERSIFTEKYNRGQWRWGHWEQIIFR
ncbi:hypothetical protein L9F63_023606, partial [Diploptera punctata]